MKYKIILISGYARNGKDTFFELLHEINPDFCGFSFANALKQDLIPLVEPMGIDIINPTEEQKKIIRNLMIAYGCAWREIDPLHWVKTTDDLISGMGSVYFFFPVIRDNRFVNETNYFIHKYGRENVFVVEVRRQGAPPPPEEELKNQPEITKIADHIFCWPTDPSFESLRPQVRAFYDTYLKEKV